MEYGEIYVRLSRQLSPKRLQHSVGVSDTAVELAKRYGCDVTQAKLAGILHDCAREFSSSQLLNQAQCFGVEVDEISRYHPVLLHGPVAAKLIQKEYGIMDSQIGMAISSHTTGGPEMSLLAKIIYLADVIEPGRSFAKLNELKSLAAKNLDAALLAAYDQGIQYIIDRGGIIHPATIHGRNELLFRARF